MRDANYQRVEVDFGEVRKSQTDDNDRLLPRKLWLVDSDGTRHEIRSVRQVNYSFGMNDIRVLKIEMIVAGVDEIYTPEVDSDENP